MWVAGDVADHGGDGPPFTVPPSAVDEQQVGRVALFAEAMSSDKPQGGVVAGLDLGLEAVKPQLLERIAQNQAETFGDVYP
jgi:hypothetical protein